MQLRQSFALVGLCCALSTGCAAPSRPADQTYVVRPQDTLYSIAWRRNLDYRELARWNHLAADYHLSVGQVLVLAPPKGGAIAPAIPAVTAAGVKGDADAKGDADPKTRADAKAAPGKPRAATGRDAVTPAGPPRSGPPSRGPPWVWPTDPESAPRPVPGGGLLLLGKLGQEIRAANAGRVVYIGSGLRGYGNLVILKHADNLLSAYAHNREMLVREGEVVAAGQRIARMGEGPHQVAALYFEIRFNGKPVNPLKYLSLR